MVHYDPAIAPEPAEWLELDEQFHVIVENQLAEGVESTVAAVARLMREGESRHNAIHAIASVLVEQIHQASKSNDPKYGDKAQAWFDAKVARLKAKDWRG